MSIRNVIEILERAANDVKSQYKAAFAPKQEYDVQEAINKIAPLLDTDTYFNVQCELRSFSRERQVEIEWGIYIENQPKRFTGPTLAEAVNAALDALGPKPEPTPQPEHPIASFNEAMQPLQQMPY